MSPRTEWYIMKHTECGAAFTFNSKTFLELDRLDGYDGKTKCPNCDKLIFDTGARMSIRELFSAQNKLSKRGLEVERLQEEDTEDILRAILKAVKKTK